MGLQEALSLRAVELHRTVGSIVRYVCKFPSLQYSCQKVSRYRSTLQASEMVLILDRSLPEDSQCSSLSDFQKNRNKWRNETNWIIEIQEVFPGCQKTVRSGHRCHHRLQSHRPGIACFP